MNAWYLYKYINRANLFFKIGLYESLNIHTGVEEKIIFIASNYNISWILLLVEQLQKFDKDATAYDIVYI